MTTKFYLDKRGIKEDEHKPCPIKIAINHHGSSAYIGTGISVLPEQWDKTSGKIVAHPQKARLNSILSAKKLDVDNSIYSLTKAGKLKGKSLSNIRQAVLDSIAQEDDGDTELFMHRFDGFTLLKQREGTRVSYEQTAKRIREFDRRADTLTFEDITRDWLSRFDAFLAKTSPAINARNIKMRNIRAVFNDAIDDGVTKWYPFRKFEIRAEATKDRSVSTEDMRRIRDCDVDTFREESRDMFILSFLLCGINLSDLSALRDIRSGRIEFNRIKTGQPVSMSVPDEAMAIIRRYAGDGYVVNISNRYRDYRTYMHKLNDNLKHLGQAYNPKTKRWEGESIVPGMSYYYARYAWATIAAELDIPEKTIAAALGHSTAKSVTAIYTRVDMRKKVDAANRKVIDYVFGEKEKADTTKQ